MKAMLLAAGEGTRLRPLTNNIPKPMMLVNGKPLLHHVIEHAAHHGIRDFVINLHYRPQTVTEYFGDGTRFGVTISYSYEPTLLGTAGAIKKVKESFDTTCLLLYGDNLTSCDLTRLCQFHKQSRGAISVALFGRKDVSQSGVAELDGDRIVRFIEKPRPNETPSKWVSAGVLVLEPEVFRSIPDHQPSDFGRDIFPALLASGHPIYGYRMGADEQLWWIDTPQDYQRVCAMLNEGGRL
jgi:NDP-sugar pyrophosphorylase family protein